MNIALMILGAILVLIGLALIPVVVKHGWRLPGPTALAIPVVVAVAGGYCVEAALGK